MCIDKKYIYSNKKILYLNQNPNIIIPIKCGLCFECLEDRSKEMNYRSYYQAKETFDKGGFVIFDTLTYRDDTVPHINDVLGINEEDNFMCFRNQDYVNFLKNLRIKLKRKYGSGHKISVLSTAEYGADDRYTHRPHYHIIFHYTNELGKPIKPYQLSLLVSDTWKYGRTDGIFWKGEHYFNKKRVFKEQNPYNLNITRYVCKYLEKESTYASVIKERTNKIIKSQGLTGNLNYFDKLEAQKIRNTIKQYSRISNNYGEYAINFIDKTELKNTGLVKFPDTKYVFKTLSIPLYFKRKLFMRLAYYNIDKDVYSKWIWTEEGREYEKAFIKQNYYNQLNKYNILFINSKEQDRIKFLLGNKSLEHFVKYLCFYRNKSYRRKLYTIDYYLNNLYNFSGKRLFNYSTSKDNTLYGDKYICNKPIKRAKRLRPIYKIKLINSLTRPEFEGFDEILTILTHEANKIGKIKHQKYLDLKERENKAKLLGLKN